jgi:hypothetical protein
MGVFSLDISPWLDQKRYKLFVYIFGQKEGLSTLWDLLDKVVLISKK